MTFEEFFKKKKINLALLKQAEPALFSEFENHYESMGEKSFAHTKKYWFNKLRRQYVLPPEPKVEKVVIENQLAEQTISESLSEPVTDKQKVGFTPRFKAPVTAAKPAEETPATEPPNSVESQEPAKPKVGFTPRFKAGATTTKSVDPIPEEVKEEPKIEEPAKPKVGFTPRFKAGTTTTKPAETIPEENKEEPKAGETAKSKVGFTPRFKAGTTTIKPTETTPEENKEEPKVEEPAKPKVGFTPRFKPPQK